MSTNLPNIIKLDLEKIQEMKFIKSKSQLNYLLFGIAFGCCFPIIALVFDICFYYKLDCSWASIKYAHMNDPLIYIIDTAPIFLGIAFGIAGSKQAAVLKLNQGLEKSSAEVDQKNKILKETLDELKRTQTNLIHTEKMSAVGQLTAGIAHEINNPINFVLSNVTPLKRDVADLISVIESIKKIDHESVKETHELIKSIDLPYTINEIDELLIGLEEGATRTAEIVRGLKNFSRTEEFGTSLTNINECIKTTVILLKHKLGKRIKIENELGDIPLINCHSGKINQVFMNLLSNSIDAIEGEGTIKIITKIYDPKQIQIILADTGKGMTPEVAQKIFDPFFTTKNVGDGTGLGLSISYGIIKEMQGSIEFTSEVDKGTTFTINLPI